MEDPFVINKSKTYLLPYINDFIPLKFVDKILNTYVFYKGEYKFCVLYKFSGKKIFLDFERELENNEYYVETIDVDFDKVLYVFDVPEEIFGILDLFFDGKYSYFPDKDKIKKFLKYHYKLPRNHRIFHILDRTEILKKTLESKLNVVIPEGLDLSDPPSTELEEFKLKPYKDVRQKQHKV